MKAFVGSRLAWAGIALVVVVALFVGASGDAGPRSNAERARDLAETIKCPTCRSQSAADSDAVAARAVRTEIARRIDAGESNGEIRAYFADRYGEEILLTPSRDGVSALVWALPVAGLVAASAGLVVVLRRWQRRTPQSPSDEDVALVESYRS